MSDRRPFVIVGDGPAERTGLGRIARDLMDHLVHSDLPLDLLQIGGGIPPAWAKWPWVPMDRSQGDWGASYVQAIYQDVFGSRPGILFVIWDPGRLLPFAQLDLPVQKWCYPAVDAANRHHQISGPARAALREFDRIIAYGRWAAGVIKDSVDHDVAYLPHGIFPQTFTVPATPDEIAWTETVFGPSCPAVALRLGCVMTNQSRKDLSLFLGLLAELRSRGHKVYGWLHTDVLVKAWSIPQLIEDYGLRKSVTVTTEGLTDRQLACLYQRCVVTVLPSGGEGFGYPLVESLASGTPCVHIPAGGGAELIPRVEWRVPARATRIDGIYGLVRPVMTAEDWANAVERTVGWIQHVGPDLAAAYCRGCCAHLSWESLWPRWHAWIKAGL